MSKVCALHNHSDQLLDGPADKEFGQPARLNWRCRLCHYRSGVCMWVDLIFIGSQKTGY